MKKKKLGHYTLEITAVILLFLVWVGLANAVFELDRFGLEEFGQQIANLYNTTDEDPVIIPDPAGEETEYTYSVCSKRTIDGKTTGFCGTGKSTTPHDNECSTDSDCPSGSNGDGGTDGGGDDGQKYFYTRCNSTGNCVNTESTVDKPNECSSDSECSAGGGDDNPPTPDTPNPEDPSDGNTKDCSYCLANGDCYTYKGPSYCTNNCANNPDICKPKEKTKTCSDCRTGSCYVYIGNEYCTDYCSSNPSICDSYNGGSSSGGDDELTPTQSWFKSITDTFAPLPGLDENETDNSNDGKHYECQINEFGNYCIALPGEGTDGCLAGNLCKSSNDGWHTECLGDNIGTTAWCRFVEGEGTDQCDNSSSCQTITNNKHTECIDDVCQWVSGQELNQCSQTDGTKCKPGGDPHGFFDNTLNTIKEFFNGLWTGFMRLFSH